MARALFVWKTYRSFFPQHSDRIIDEMVVRGLRVSVFSAEAQDIRVGEIQRGAVPAEIVSDTYMVRNCSSITRPSEVDLEIKTRVGQTITISSSSVETTNLNLSLKFPFGQKGEVGAESGRTLQVNLLRSVQNESLSEVSITEHVERTVAPWHALYVTVERTKRFDRWPFKGAVKFDGRASFQGFLGTLRPTERAQGFADILKEEDRTISVDGYVTNI